MFKSGQNKPYFIKKWEPIHETKEPRPFANNARWRAPIRGLRHAILALTLARQFRKYQRGAF